MSCVRTRSRCDAWLLLAVLTSSAPVAAQEPSTAPSAQAGAPAAPAEVSAPTAEPNAPTGPVVETVVITASPAVTTDAPASPAAPLDAPTPSTRAEASSSSAQPRRTSVVRPRPMLDTTPAVTPVASPWSLMATVDHRWNTSPAFDLYADTDVTQFYGLALGYDVASLAENLWLNAELGWNAGGTERDDFGGTLMRSELFTHNVHAAITGRYEVLPWLAPHARVSLGLSVVDMKLQSAGDNVSFKDEVIAPMLGLGVGASLQTAPRALASRNGDLASLRLGVRFEVGYTFAGNAGFALKGADDVRVPVTESSLGGLPRSGPTLHTAVFVRL